MTSRKFKEARKKRLRDKTETMESLFFPYTVRTKKEEVQHRQVLTSLNFKPLAPFKERRYIR